MLREYRINWHKRKIVRLEREAEELSAMMTRMESFPETYPRGIVERRGYIAELQEKLRQLELKE